MTTENFSELFEESLAVQVGFQGSVVSGTIIHVDGDAVTIDVGLKSEGRIPLKEFGVADEASSLVSGDKIDVFVERYEDKDGLVRLSREKARREEAWTALEKMFKAEERVNGTIFGRVKGGFIVDLDGAVAFLPGSQVDIRPVRDITPLMGNPQPFQILKMDRARNNIVVSRRAILEETRAEERSELIGKLNEGDVVDGVVKNITDYGAFVDLGGVDGLLHVTDIAWKRINHPSEALQVGETIKVKVIRFNSENQRISLGMKQLQDDPWKGVGERFPISSRVKGRVTNITDYGAFVELESGVEGLVHVSEMSWTKKNVHPGKIVSTSQEVEVMVLDVDADKRRISLGLKQCGDNPWDSFLGTHTAGSEIEGEIKNITEFGLFVGLTEEIDGMVHLSDLAWDKSGEEAIKDYKKGDMIKAKVLDVDVVKERISLGVKQLTKDPFEGAVSASGGMKKGTIVTCTVTAITDGGIEVSVGEGLHGFIRKTELSRDRSEQRPDRYAAGEKVDAKITNVDERSRKLTLSIKALEAQEEKKAMAEFGSNSAGASLGDILGAALEEKKAAGATDKPAPKKKAATKKAAASTDEEETAEEKKPVKKAAAKKTAAKKTATKKTAAKKKAATKDKE